MDYLSSFVEFLIQWKHKCPKRGLTWQTSTALIQTLKSIVALSEFLIREGVLKFILIGKLTSDPIEGRFGWYRQSCGGSYFVTMRQILEAEKKIRTLSLMKTCLTYDLNITTLLKEFCAKDLAARLEHYDASWALQLLPNECSLEEIDETDLPGKCMELWNKRSVKLCVLKVYIALVAT